MESMPIVKSLIVCARSYHRIRSGCQIIQWDCSLPFHEVKDDLEELNSFVHWKREVKQRFTLEEEANSSAALHILLSLLF